MPELIKTWTFDANADGWTVVTSNGTGNYVASGGVTTGYLNVNITGRNKTEDGYWLVTTTFEALGVPAGATITGYGLCSYYGRCLVYNVVDYAHHGDLANTEGALFINDGVARTLITSQPSYTGTTAWAQTSNNPNITGLSLPSTTSIELHANHDIDLANDAAAEAEIGWDNISITIFYENAGQTFNDAISVNQNLNAENLRDILTNANVSVNQNLNAENLRDILTNANVSITQLLNLLTDTKTYTGYAAEVMADNPVAYWRLGDASGTVAASETGSHDGTYVNSPTLGVAGALSGDDDTAVSFSGAASQYVNFSDVAAVKTVECWINVFNCAATEYFVGGTTDGNNGVRYNPTSGFLFFTGGTGWTELAHTAQNRYIHLVAVRTSATTVDWYIDGQHAGQTNPSNNARDLTLSRIATRELNYYFNGPVDEVALYSTTLSAARITAHYDAGAPASQTFNDTISIANINSITNERNITTLSNIAMSKDINEDIIRNLLLFALLNNSTTINITPEYIISKICYLLLTQNHSIEQQNTIITTLVQLLSSNYDILTAYELITNVILSINKSLDINSNATIIITLLTQLTSSYEIIPSLLGQIVETLILNTNFSLENLNILISNVILNIYKNNSIDTTSSIIVDILFHLSSTTNTDIVRNVFKNVIIALLNHTDILSISTLIAQVYSILSTELDAFNTSELLALSNLNLNAENVLQLSAVGNYITSILFDTEASENIETLAIFNNTININSQYVHIFDVLYENEVRLNLRYNLSIITEAFSNLFATLEVILDKNLDSDIEKLIFTDVSFSKNLDTNTLNTLSALADISLGYSSEALYNLTTDLQAALSLTSETNTPILSSLILTGQLNVGTKIQDILGSAGILNSEVAITNAVSLQILKTVILDAGIEISNTFVVKTQFGFDLFVETPAKRILVIRFDNRDFTVTFEDREKTLPSEDRNTIIPGKS